MGACLTSISSKNKTRMLIIYYTSNHLAMYYYTEDKCTDEPTKPILLDNSEKVHQYPPPQQPKPQESNSQAPENKISLLYGYNNLTSNPLLLTTVYPIIYQYEPSRSLPHYEGQQINYQSQQYLDQFCNCEMCNNV